MNRLSITQLARRFGLSRSTLLYYDRIGLLRPSGRTHAGYRLYTTREEKRLDRICRFRQAGLSLAEIRICLNAGGKPNAKVLEQRLRLNSREIVGLRNQQRLLAAMLARLSSGARAPIVDKQMWVEMLRAAGMDEKAMHRWHAEFELRAPEAHHEFLQSLGIPEAEVVPIRNWARAGVAN